MLVTAVVYVASPHSTHLVFVPSLLSSPHKWSRNKINSRQNVLASFALCIIIANLQLVPSVILVTVNRNHTAGTLVFSEPSHRRPSSPYEWQHADHRHSVAASSSWAVHTTFKSMWCNYCVLCDSQLSQIQVTVPSATQHRPFGMDFLLQLLPPVHWNVSNGHSKLNCTVVRLTETDLWPPALKILPSEWLLVRYQPYNNII